MATSADRRTVLAAAPPPATMHDVALLDLDGVVYVGPDAVPGAVDAIARAAEHGLRAVYVTNNASRTPQAVATHLRQLGVPARDQDVVTSAQLAAGILAAKYPAGTIVLVVGGDGLVQALREEGLRPVTRMDEAGDAAEAVVQGFAPTLGWADLAEGARAVRAGLYWVATNVDMTVPTPHGRAPGNGTLVAAVAEAAGREPDAIAGKPEPRAFRDAADRAGSSRPLVVGDRLDTDLEGARAAGIPGLLVLTGVTGISELLACPPQRRPDLVGRDLAALLAEHPAAAATTDGEGGCEGRCGAATVTVAGGVVDVRSPGPDPLDLLRAACAAAWSVHGDLDPAPIVDAVHDLEPGAAWAR